MKLKRYGELRDEETKLKMELLLSRLKQHSSPLRPYDTFDVNYESALSLMSIVLTYLMVLLQFKVTDVQEADYYSSLINNNSTTTN